ncbi:hypothetical protein QJS10_CPA01g01197 [Acorus calamus]|uniref:RNase H type-1 domain-containing protein n=1 Tax=Acorus calamus TaxID=4465 RepID=A0AAV9FHL1_ACOCL|nr:hypothetical protein QJS10_CPA01g01197 [Acorus calamus]
MEEETTKHLFTQCPFGADCWRLLPTWLHPPLRTWSARSWLHVFSDEIWSNTYFKHVQQVTLALMLWQLWRCRNEWIFRRQEPQPLMVATRVLIRAKECAQKLMKHTEDSQSLRILQSQVCMPFKAMGPCGTVHLTGDSILLTDGSVDGQSGGAGAGFVAICTSPFRILGAGYAGWPWATPLRMEAEAIRLGVRFMQGQGIPISCICSDSLSLIQLLQSGSPGPPQVQDAIAEIQRTVSPLSVWQFCKVPRDLVRVPEVLARFARRKVESKWCLELHDPLIRRLLGPVIMSIHACVEFINMTFG